MSVVATQKQDTPVATPREEYRIPAGRKVTPPVDIFDTDDGLGVVVDLPGVAKDHVDVRVENDVLTISGTAQSEPKGTVLYREFELVDYFRQFQLTDHFDQEKIKAEMKNGVLTIQLPKAEKAKPKRITVNVTS